jgi:hypothetical protein
MKHGGYQGCVRLRLERRNAPNCNGLWLAQQPGPICSAMSALDMWPLFSAGQRRHRGPQRELVAKKGPVAEPRQPGIQPNPANTAYGAVGDACEYEHLLHQVLDPRRNFLTVPLTSSNNQKGVVSRNRADDL